MDFTREPIIETVITPKEGCKLVVRSSKSSGQEEYFVDAVEVVSFGNSFFFRSLERPKAFLVPVSDYEILEVREARMVLKNVGIDRSIKIGGGKEGTLKTTKEGAPEKTGSVSEPSEEGGTPVEGEIGKEPREAGRLDKKRDRRTRYRRRRGGREEVLPKEETPGSENLQEQEKVDLPFPVEESAGEVLSAQTLLSSILPPPPTLISETIARYKDNAMFKGAFFLKDESKEGEEKEGEQGKEDEGIEVPLEEPRISPFAISEEEEEEIYRHRATSFSLEDELMQQPKEPPYNFSEGPSESKDAEHLEHPEEEK